MRSLTFVALSLLAGATFTGRTAGAGFFPSAFHSSMPSPVTACPAGDVVYRIVLRDTYHRPMPGVGVYLAFEGCPSVRLAPVLGDEVYQVGQGYVRRVTDAAAWSEFPLRAGGTCPAPGVGIHVGGGYNLTYRPLASPDQDGSLTVGPDDLALVEAKLGTADPTADFDADGAVTTADLDFLRGHLGHQAPSDATPVASPTWGRIKRLYR